VPGGVLVGRRGGEPVGRAVAIDAHAGSPGTASGVSAVRLGRPTSGAEVDGAIFQCPGRRGRAAVLGGAAGRRVHRRRRRAGKHVSQAGHALGRRLRRGAPTPRPQPQGSLPVVRRARGDRAGPGAWRDDARDRPAAGAGAVDGLARAGPQRRRPRLPGDDRARARVRAREPPQAGQARHQPAVADGRAGRSVPALLARADRGAAAPPVPRRPGDVGVDRDDLPVAVRAVQGRAAARAHPLPADRPGAAQAGPPGRPAQERIPDMVNIARRPRRPTTAPCPATGRATC
jgi:hypothetical protein